MGVWSEEHWDRPGYVNGKRDHLFVKPAASGEGHCGSSYKFTLLNCQRPHGRAFHVAWFAFFSCFIMWFAIPPLMVTIKKPKCDADADFCKPQGACSINGETTQSLLGADYNPEYTDWSQYTDKVYDKILKDKTCAKCYPYQKGNGKGCGGIGLSKNQILVSNVVSVSGTIIVRVLIGPLADWIGVRYTYSALLVLFSVPGFLASTVTTYGGLVVVRFFISLVGGSFVITQLWTTIMFHSNVVGLANATSAGWGNLGGGAALAIMGAVFNSLKKSGLSNDQAWRRALAWPPAVLLTTGIVAFFFTDDCPFGNYGEMKKRKAATQAPEVDDGSDLQGGAEPVSVAGRSLKVAAANWRTWVLFLVYAFSFGVELVVYGNIALYFSNAFDLSQGDGGLAGSLFGLFNLFARSLGGWMSDKFNEHWGVRGRLWALFICTLLMGVFLLVFTNVTLDNGGFGGALGSLAAWALWLAMTEGAVFAVVPYVEPTAVGGVAGIVGAGGNCGALGGNFILRIGVRPGFMVLGWLATISAFLVPLLWLPGVGSMFRSQTEGLAQPPAPAPAKKTAEEATAPATRDVQLTPVTSGQAPGMAPMAPVMYGQAPMMAPGMQPMVQPGMQPGMQMPMMAPGMQPMMAPGMQPMMQPGMQMPMGYPMMHGQG